MPALDQIISDEEYMIMRAKELQTYDIYSAKAWMLTAKTLFPTNFKIQFEAYLMEKQSGNVQEAAECFSSLMMSSDNISNLLPEISAIANALKCPETSFLSQMFDKICPDIQLTILKTSVENSDDTMEHCRLLVLLLKKFPQLGVDGMVKTLMNAEKFFYDNRYARLLVVETLPLLSSLESPRLLQRLVVRAIDFYNSYVNEDGEEDITDPWQRLYGVLDLLGRLLKWDPFFTHFPNTYNKDTYFQKLAALRNSEDCRLLLYCGTTFFLRSLREKKTIKGNILIEAFCDPELPLSKRRKGDIEITGASAHQFQAAANCWELLHCNEIISREFNKLASQLQVKLWADGFTEELSLYRGRYEEAFPAPSTSNINASLVRISITYIQKKYQICLEHILKALSQLPPLEGVLDMELIVGGTHRHLHFLPMTKVAILHYICTLLIKILLNVGGVSDLAYGHMMVLMQLGWPQEESIFLRIIDTIRQKSVFHYHLFQPYIIHIDILEEISFLWNEQGNNIVLDIIPNSQQHLGQRRIGTRGADKGVKEDFKQAMKAQVARSNESIVNLMIHFITEEHDYLLQLL